MYLHLDLLITCCDVNFFYWNIILEKSGISWSCADLDIPVIQCFDLLLLLLHPFNGFFSRTTYVNWHQKGIIPDFTGGRDDGVAVASAGPYANYLHLGPDR